MKQAKIGVSKVPSIGQGTYGFGGHFDRSGAGHLKELIEALRFGMSLGLTLIDTAEIYSSGMSEEIVGKAISTLDRDQIFLATKVWRNHLEPDKVISSCKKSLERMGVKSLDLYQIHWPDEAVPMKDTLRAFEKLVDEGLVSNIGVSNFSVPEMEEAMACLGRHELASNQVHYSIDYRNIEKQILPFCKENNISVIAYSPLGTGDTLHGKKAKGLSEIAAKHGKSKAQVALNWLSTKQVISIPKAAKKDHIMENASALDFELSTEDIASLERT